MGQDFCYWDAKSKPDVIAIIINQTIVTSIMITAICRIPNFYNLIQEKLTIDIKKIAFIHIIILLWAIFQSTVNYYSIATYLSVQHQLTSIQMIGYSHTYALISSFPGFLVQTLFITICLTFCRNVVRQTDIRNFPLYSIKLVYLIQIYYIARIIIRITIIFLIAFSSNTDVSIYSTTQFISLIIDCAIINIFIFLSIRIFINRLDHNTFRRLRVQYWIMFCCSICRIVIDSLYLVINSQYSNGSYCISQTHYRPLYTAFYNVIGNFFMHFIPIAIILKIYRFDFREEKEKEELIAKTQHLGDGEN